MKFKFSAKFFLRYKRNILGCMNLNLHMHAVKMTDGPDVHTTSVFGIISIHTFEIGSLSGLREMQNVVSPDYYEDS